MINVDFIVILWKGQSHKLQTQERKKENHQWLSLFSASNNKILVIFSSFSLPKNCSKLQITRWEHQHVPGSQKKQNKSETLSLDFTTKLFNSTTIFPRLLLSKPFEKKLFSSIWTFIKSQRISWIDYSRIKTWTIWFISFRNGTPRRRCRHNHHSSIREWALSS